MLTTSCPSCASPLTFRSGAALTTICPSCGTCVVREGDVVRDYGKIARFQRDLSPIQVGTQGTSEGRGFRVAGVLRKGRDRVRWNEWFVVFDDGETGWIGEGNGQWFFYGDRHEIPARALGSASVGGELTLAGIHFTVLEHGEAAVLAADGELLSPVTPEQRARYLDLREASGGRVGTLDLADDPPVLWVGRDVSLVELKMEGLRPFAGWSDPVLVQFAGPEISAIRTMACAACGASVPILAPGLSQRLACAYCGSTMDLEADDGPIRAELVARTTKPTFQPRLELGSRGTLAGVERQVIGAMVRSVQEDGMKWSWVEYLLYNPYRGFAWLVCDTNRHWSLATALTGAAPRGNERKRIVDGDMYKRFQGGTATVDHVLGEFTWEVAVSDSATTVDYICPPRMLSCERTDGEITWTIGEWISVTTVEKAFKVDLGRASGVAPHQPNPCDAPLAYASAVARGGALAVVGALLAVIALVLPDREALLAHEYLVTESENAWVTSALRLDADSVVEIQLDSAVSGSPDVMISFVHDATGEAWSWTAYGDDSESAALAAGSWTGRVEIPAGQTLAAGGTITVSAVRDPGYATPAVLLFLWSILAPIAWMLDRARFETARWQNGGT